MLLISDGKPIKTPDGKYRLIEDWKFWHDEFPYPLVVKKGYVCDLASIPKWAWWWKRGLWDIAAIAHDHVCDFNLLYIERPDYLIPQPLTREQGDWLFYEICLAVGVPTTTALAMYIAVRTYSIYQKIIAIIY